MRSKLRRSCAVHFARPFLHARSSRFGVTASWSLTRTSILHGPPPDVFSAFQMVLLRAQSAGKNIHTYPRHAILAMESAYSLFQEVSTKWSLPAYLEKRSLTSVLNPVIRTRSLSLAPPHSHIYVTDFFQTTWRLFSPCSSLLWSS